MSFRLQIQDEAYAGRDRERVVAALLRQVEASLRASVKGGTTHRNDLYQNIHDRKGAVVGGFAFKQGRAFD